MHAPLRLSARHALHAMHAAFVPAPHRAPVSLAPSIGRRAIFQGFFSLFSPFFDFLLASLTFGHKIGGKIHQRAVAENTRGQSIEKKVVSRAKNGKKGDPKIEAKKGCKKKAAKMATLGRARVDF